MLREKEPAVTQLYRVEVPPFSFSPPNKNATLVAHYYVSPDLQTLAEETGGIVSDSLEMARFGQNCDAETIVVAGVKFMGETPKEFTSEINEGKWNSKFE